MGHYASEMDPHWGEPSYSDIKLAEIEDETMRNLAKCLFKGFERRGHLAVQSGISTAQATDELVKLRIAEALELLES